MNEYLNINYQRSDIYQNSNFLKLSIFQVEKVQTINIVLDALIAEVIDVSDMTQIIR